MSKNKQITLIIVLAVAILAASAFLVFGIKFYGADDAGDDNEAISTTETAATTIPTTTAEPSSEDPSKTAAENRTVLKILIPEQKYKDVEKLVDAYNEDDNKFTIDLVHTSTAAGIDPMAYDALIIPGGKHVHPSFYGAEVECDKHGFNQDLDRMELDLVYAFVDAGKPILGLCRGSQLVNVALGGTLKQDVGMGHYHDAVRETITVEGSDMRKIWGDSVKTVHYHHQAVDQLADDLVVTMVDAEDGTIEAYVHKTLPIIGYQFHPDRMYVKDDPVIKDTGRVFMDYFFQICQEQKEK